MNNFTAKPETGLLGRLKQGLGKTRAKFGAGLAALFSRWEPIDGQRLEELETLLLTADVGIETTTVILEDLRARLKRHELNDKDALLSSIKHVMVEQLSGVSVPWSLPSEFDKPYVILMVGVNGTGKTTTIAKLAHRLQAAGHSVLMAAGDTFRAAAADQLQAWGQRLDLPVVAQQPGADSAAVIYDAIQAAIARHTDVVIADTAGRLHTQCNLMEELKKVKRVIAKAKPDAPHEVMLVIDAGTGQNALVQASEFHAAVGLTGLILAKLDGTAKGGIVFAIASKLDLPLRFIGVGEGIDDLLAFDANAFVAAVLENTNIP